MDQVLSSELFQTFLGDSCHSGFAELGKKLAKEKEQQKLLSQLQLYYTSERRHLLRCVKHLFGYWQDSSHPYRVGRVCVCEVGVVWVGHRVHVFVCVCVGDV